MLIQYTTRAIALLCLTMIRHSLPSTLCQSKNHKCYTCVAVFAIGHSLRSKEKQPAQLCRSNGGMPQQAGTIISIVGLVHNGGEGVGPRLSGAG